MNIDSIDLGASKLNVIRIRGGSFQMGSPNQMFSENPSHRVTIANDFWLGRFPVTQRQWSEVMGDNPSTFKTTDDLPVDGVAWLDAKEFCRLLSVRIGRQVDLPSEAQWEYACRAGTTSELFFSKSGPFIDDVAIPPEARRQLRDFAWFDENSFGMTQPVGGKTPNPWGLHDMIGNVWEWCADFWHDDYQGAPCDGSPWLQRRGPKPLRCLRGGAWDMNAFRCRSTYRSWDLEDVATSRYGLRICITT